MIKFDEKEHRDARFFNKCISDTLYGAQGTFTEDQELRIKQLIRTLASGYQHTISRIEWGPGWD